MPRVGEQQDQSVDPAVRRLSASLRASACSSEGRVSASTAQRIGGWKPDTTASHARRSPGIGMGTSVRSWSPGWQPRWNRSRTRLAAGVPERITGREEPDRELEPEAAPTRASSSTDTSPSSPRSIRPYRPRLMPAAAATSSCESPALNRPESSSRVQRRAQGSSAGGADVDQSLPGSHRAQDDQERSTAAYAGGSPGSSPVAIGSPERDQSLYEPT